MFSNLKISVTSHHLGYIAFFNLINYNLYLTLSVPCILNLIKHINSMWKIFFVIMQIYFCPSLNCSVCIHRFHSPPILSILLCSLILKFNASFFTFSVFFFSQWEIGAWITEVILLDKHSAMYLCCLIAISLGSFEEKSKCRNLGKCTFIHL